MFLARATDCKGHCYQLYYLMGCTANITHSVEATTYSNVDSCFAWMLIAALRFAISLLQCPSVLTCGFVSELKGVSI